MICGTATSFKQITLAICASLVSWASCLGGSMCYGNEQSRTMVPISWEILLQEHILYLVLNFHSVIKPDPLCISVRVCE